MMPVQSIARFAVFAGLACTFAAFGDTYYLTTTRSGASAGFAPTNALWWATGDGVTVGEATTDPLPPEHDYVVGKNYQFQMNATVKSFPNHSLTFGLASGSYKGKGTFNDYCGTKSTTVYMGSHLILHSGSFRAMSSSSAQYNVNAELATVTAPESAPFQLLFRYSSQTWDIVSPMEAAEGAALLCGDTSEASRENSARWGTFVFTNDWSRYCGALIVTSRYERVSAEDFGIRVKFGALDLPGRLAMRHDTILAADEAVPLKVGTLELGDNCALELKCTMAGDVCTNASITVTNSFTMGGTALVSLDEWEPGIGDCDGATSNEVTILTVPAASTLDPAAFTVELGTLAAAIPHELLVVEDTVAGVKRLVVRFEPMVRQTVSDPDTFNRASKDIPCPNSCTNAEHWSDGQLPHAGAHYLIVKNGSAKTWLRTPQDTDGVNDNTIDFTFPGKSLIIGNGCGITVFGRHFRAERIVLLPGADIQNGQTHYPDIHADIFAPSGDVHVSAYNGNAMVLDGELTGAANLLMGSVGGSTSAPTGSEYFKHANTNFFGTMAVYMRKNTGSASPSKYHSLKVGDERNLGGRLEEFNPTALTVHGPWTHLIAATNVTLTPAYNRGVYFYDHPVIDTDKYTMAITTRLGVWGNVEKAGTGTLELGGELAFAGGTATEPTEGSNTLAVTKGALAVSAAGAVDGLALVFTNDTSLVLKPDFGNAEFLASGIRNVKAAMPFAISGSLEKLPLVVDAGGALPPTPCTMGLVTVSAAAADSVREILEKPAKFCDGVRISAIREIADGEAGTVTFAVDVHSPGLRMIVR